MKAAFAVLGDRISPVFDVARELLVLDIDDGEVHESFREQFEVETPVLIAAELKALGIHTLVCGAISRGLAAMISAYGIRIFPFTAGEVGRVVDAYCAGSLPDPDFGMPGASFRKRRKRRDRERRGFRDMAGGGPFAPGPEGV